MTVISTKIPGVLLLMPSTARDIRGVRCDLDLAALGDGPGAFVTLASTTYHALPKSAHPALISDGARLVRVLDGVLYVGLADTRRGMPAAHDCVALANGGLPHAGAALLVPGGVAVGFVVGDMVTRFVVDRASAKPCVVAPDGLLRWPIPAALPAAPIPALTRQQVRAMAPPPEPEPPAPEPRPQRAVGEPWEAWCAREAAWQESYGA